MKFEVKFFGSLNPLKKSFGGEESFFDQIEQEINTWLLARPNIEIVEIKQSAPSTTFSPSQLIISVWYKTDRNT